MRKICSANTDWQLVDVLMARLILLSGSQSTFNKLFDLNRFDTLCN